MRIFHQFTIGIKQLLIERPILFAVSIVAGIAPLFWFLNDRTLTPLDIISELFWVLVLVELIGIYGRKVTPRKHSQAVILKEDGTLSMRIVSYVPGGKDPNEFGKLLNYDPGNILEFSLVFQNHTGEEIYTDTSFVFEQKLWGKWYVLEYLESGTAPWEPLVIPVGVSDKLRIPAVGRYQILNPGNYRVLKTIPTKQGAVTLASEFTIDDVGAG